MPEKDNFIIKASNFQNDSLDISTNSGISNLKERIMFSTNGIKLIQEDEIFNLDYENMSIKNINNKRNIRNIKENKNEPKPRKKVYKKIHRLQLFNLIKN